MKGLNLSLGPIGQGQALVSLVLDSGCSCVITVN